MIWSANSGREGRAAETAIATDETDRVSITVRIPGKVRKTEFVISKSPLCGWIGTEPEGRVGTEFV
jgi:hypothetical protein